MTNQTSLTLRNAEVFTFRTHIGTVEFSPTGITFHRQDFLGDLTTGLKRDKRMRLIVYLSFIAIGCLAIAVSQLLEGRWAGGAMFIVLALIAGFFSVSSYSSGLQSHFPNDEGIPCQVMYWGAIPIFAYGGFKLQYVNEKGKPKSHWFWVPQEDIAGVRAYCNAYL
jgi:hypothetical protein